MAIQKFTPIRENISPRELRGEKAPRVLLALLLGLCLIPALSHAEEPGVTDKLIRIGASGPMEGDLKALGQNTKLGIEAALAGQTVQKRTVQFEQLNDFYDPEKAVANTKQLISKGIFAIVSSSGTPTVRAVLPVLAENKIPMFAPYTGAGFAGPGDVLNFRVPYAKEIESLVEVALANGVKPSGICAYVQNDGFGMSGVKGFRDALAKQSGTEAIVAKLDQILNQTGDNPARNGIGPVGVYPKDVIPAKAGYDSLKKWEKDSGTPCRLVMTVAVLAPAAEFMGFAHYKNEPWTYSVISLAGGDAFAKLLKEKGIQDKVITTQVVPALDSPLPIVTEARKNLGANLNYTSLESYIVGKLFVTILQAIDGPLTRENFLKAAHRQPYDIGGVKVDFTSDNQGSDFVSFTLLRDGHFVPVSPQDPELAKLFK